MAYARAREPPQTLRAGVRVDVLVNNAFRSYAFDPEQRQAFGELAWADYQAQFRRG